MDRLSTPPLDGDETTVAEAGQIGADVLVAHAARLLEGGLDDLLDSGGRNDLLDQYLLVAAEHRIDGLPDLP